MTTLLGPSGETGWTIYHLGDPPPGRRCVDADACEMAKVWERIARDQEKLPIGGLRIEFSGADRFGRCTFCNRLRRRL